MPYTITVPGLPGGPLTLGTFEPDIGLIAIEVNGVPVVGLDFTYLDPDEDDPAQVPSWAPLVAGPHLVVGYWEDDDNGTWVRVREVAIDEQPT